MHSTTTPSKNELCEVIKAHNVSQFFFLINVGVQVSLYASQLILRALKLTII